MRQPGEPTNFTIINSSKEQLTLSAKVEGDSADFHIDESCANVAPESTCTLKIRFFPTVAEERTAHVVVSDAAGRMLVSGELIGTGTPEAPEMPEVLPEVTGTSDNGATNGTDGTTTAGTDGTTAVTPVARQIRFDPSPVAFESSEVGGPQQTARVRLINLDAEAFRPTRPTLGASHSPTITIRSENCSSAALQIDGDCSIEVGLDPKTPGQQRATLSLKDDRGFAHSIDITADVNPPPGRGIVFNPNPVTFAAQPAGIASAPRSVTLKNTDNMTHSALYAPLDATTTANFLVAGLCKTFFFNAGSECTEQVSFRPQGRGTHAGTVSIRDATGAVLGTLRLEGSAQSVAMRVNPSQLDFSPPNDRNQSVTVTNEGDAPFVIGPLRLDAGHDSGAFYNDSPACLSQPLAAQGTCRIGVHYQAGFAGTADTHSAQLVIKPDALPEARVQMVWNRPLAPAAAADPPSLTFDTVTVGSEAVQRVVFTNTGNGPANSVVVGFTSDNTPFSVAQNGCTTFPPQSQCTVLIRFRPTQAGHARATLRFWSTDPLMQLTTVSVEGDGSVVQDATGVT